MGKGRGKDDATLVRTLAHRPIDAARSTCARLTDEGDILREASPLISRDGFARISNIALVREASREFHSGTTKCCLAADWELHSSALQKMD